MSRRNGTTRTSRAAEAVAAAAADEAPEATTAPEDQQGPNIADRFVGMNELVVRERQRTRLSETTLTKILELAMNYHVWTTQREEQQRAINPAELFWSGGESANGDESLVGPTPNEYIGEAQDSGPTASGVGEVIYPDDPRHPNYEANMAAAAAAAPEPPVLSVVE